MKKNLLLLSSVLFAFSLNSQNNSRGNVIASPSENISQNNKVAKFKDKSESVGMCDTLNWPISSTWTGTNYYLTATPQFNDGWVNGINVYADKEKAQYFDASSSSYSLLHGFFFQVGKAYSQNPNKIVTFRIYDGTSGSPGALLAGSTKTRTMGQLMADYQNNFYTEIVYTTPVTLPGSKRFFISVDITGLTWATTPKDTFNIVSNLDPETTPGAAWEKQNSNAWYNENDATNSWNLNISLYIFPYLTNTPNVVSYTQNPIQSAQVCTGIPITFNATASTASQVLWDFNNGTPASSTAFTQATTWATAGTYPVKLYTIGSECPIFDSLSSTVTIIPSPNLIVTTTPSTICPSGSSILNASGASTYVWTPSGSLSSSTGGTVTATPTTTTVYTVTGTGSNGCTSSALAPITFVGAPAASVTTTSTIICVGQSVGFNASGSTNVTTYSWAFQGGTPATSNIVNPTITYNTLGVYNARLYASNMCGTDSSYTTTVTVNCMVGLDEVSLNNSINTIYNSLSENLEVNIKNGSLNGKYSINIVNALGQIVCSENIEISNGEAHLKINMAKVSDGIYFMHINGNEVNFAKKFIKE